MATNNAVTEKNENNSNSKKIVFNKVKYQFLAALCANFFIVGHGCSVGWVSPSLPILLSDESPIGQISREDASWIGALFSLGAGVGVLSFGMLSVYIGNKKSLILCVFPSLIFWSIVIYAQMAWQISIGRFVTGLATGSFICVQLFVAEIADDHVRGAIGSLLTLNFNIGILFGYIGGTYLTYSQVPYVMIAFPIIFLAVFAFMPDSPQHFLRCGKLEKAETALRFYRNCKPTDQDDMRLQKELEKLKAIATQTEWGDPLRLSDFFAPDAWRAMLIGPTLMAISQFSGTFCVITYAKTIFSNSGSNFNPNTSAIILACLQILGTYCTSMLIEKLGRKFLLGISCAGASVGLTVMGAYSWMSANGFDLEQFHLVPVISLSFVIFISSIGIIPIPYIIIAEVLPLRIRKVGGPICMSSVSFFAFIMLMIFPYLMHYLQLHGCMFLFAAVSAFGLVYTIYVVPETRGKNLDNLEIPVKKISV